MTVHFQWAKFQLLRTHLLEYPYQTHAVQRHEMQMLLVTRFDLQKPVLFLVLAVELRLVHGLDSDSHSLDAEPVALLEVVRAVVHSELQNPVHALVLLIAVYQQLLLVDFALSDALLSMDDDRWS